MCKTCLCSCVQTRLVSGQGQDFRNALSLRRAAPLRASRFTILSTLSLSSRKIVAKTSIRSTAWYASCAQHRVATEFRAKNNFGSMAVAVAQRTRDARSQ
eukprot:TRINITY_DN67837_c0_g1_i1.p1 TRINITY_DN67837_c0_g1~~TRINITY_DN67837_c0_g1_i1.p1  ORF type:complete len:100 (-),score=5.25 TRINITY_DN67837_c0_g1_i1:157-456(-)